MDSISSSISLCEEEFDPMLADHEKDCLVVSGTESCDPSSQDLTVHRNQKNSPDEELPLSKNYAQNFEGVANEITRIQEVHKEEILKLEKSWMIRIEQVKEDVQKEYEKKLNEKDLSYSFLCVELQQKLMDLSDGYVKKWQTLQDRNERLEAELGEKDDKLASLTKEYNESITSLKKLYSTEIDNLKAKNEDYVKKLNEKEHELHTQHQKEKAELEATAKDEMHKALDLAKKKCQIKLMEKENALTSLEEKHRQAIQHLENSRKSEKEECEEKLKALDSKHTLLCAELQQKLSDVSDNFKEKGQTLEDKNKELTSELDKLRTDLIVVQRERNNAIKKKEELLCERNSLRKDIRITKKECEEKLKAQDSKYTSLLLFFNKNFRM